MLMYNVIEYINNYAKTLGTLWQYHKDILCANIADSKSFKFKARVTGRMPADGNTKDVGITVVLKYLSNLWSTLKIPLINFKVNLIITWLKEHSQLLV